MILGVVGWVDLTDPEVADTIEQLRRLPGGERLVGIRHQVQGEDRDWLLRKDVRRGLEAVAAAGLAYDILVRPDQLPAAIAVADRVPGLRWVLDHAGKPPIVSGDLRAWKDDITTLAENDRVACKLSGLVTETAANWRHEDVAPCAEHVLATFGADRVMFGSDWPVCLLRTSYDEVVALTEDFVQGLTAAEQADVWGRTAQRWYGLSGR